MRNSLKRMMIATVMCSTLFGSVFTHAATPLEETVNELQGVRYVYGGTTLQGFDCSGFTQYVFAQFGVELNRVSRDQAKQGVQVSRHNLQPGDLVFFNTSGSGISHVGIYLGQDVFIHSASKVGVKKNNLNEAYYAKRYVTARRVLSDEQAANLNSAVSVSVQEEAADAQLAAAEASEEAEAALFEGVADEPLVEVEYVKPEVLQNEEAVQLLVQNLFNSGLLRNIK